MNHVDLDRQFGEIPTAEPGDEHNRESYFGGHSFGPFVGWPDLLKERLVVILGEPGSGKTQELRNQYSLARRSSVRSFLIPLERLVSEPLSEILSPDEFRDFKRWRRSKTTAMVFLDSVDEAKLRTHNGFHTAIDRLCIEIGPGPLQRSRFFITSRISEWLPGLDRDKVEERLGACLKENESDSPSQDDLDQDEQIMSEEPEEDEPTEGTRLVVVQIEPLDRERLVKFAEALKLPDPEKFVAAIDERYAWDFARRPLDVIDLMEFWRDKRRLGNLTEIISHDVALKLRERDARRSTAVLSEQQSVHGAMTLAAGAIFCRRIAFKVPDDTVAAPGSLDAKECLPANWTPAQISALLSRPIFDSVNYGRIRFHHRRIAEYLAAQWLTRCMTEGCPITVLKDVLFADDGGTLVMRPSSAPLAAWLCAGGERWKSDLRSWVIRTRPEVFLEHGDPAALTIQFKRELLQALPLRFADRERAWIPSSPDTLRRFADPALASDLSTLILDESLALDVREQLLQIVQYGHLTQCLDTCLEIVGSEVESEELRRAAAEAIRDGGTPEIKRRFYEVVTRIPLLSIRLCTVVVETLYPSAIDAAAVASILAKVREEPGRRVDTHWLVSHITESKPLPDAGALLVELLKLLQPLANGDDDDVEDELSDDQLWLLDIALPVVGAVLTSSHVAPEDSINVARLLTVAGGSYLYRQRNHTQLLEIERLTLPHPAVRRACCWAAVNHARKPERKPWFYVHTMDRRIPCWNWAQSDIDWLLEDVSTRSGDDDREIALHLALHVWNKFGRNNADRRRILQATRSSAPLTTIARAEIAASRFATLKRYKAKFADRSFWIGLRMDIQNWLERKWAHLRNNWFWLRNCRTLRNGTNPELLFYPCHKARENSRSRRTFNWDLLKQTDGRFVAHSARQGCKRAWRRFTPNLPHEKSRPEDFDGRIDIGLAGIEAEITDGNIEFDALPQQDVILAAKYAVNELGGFPKWFQTLASQRPEEVAEVLRQCVVAEWQYLAARERTNDVLADLAWSGGAAAALVRDCVLNCLAFGDAPHVSILQQGLSLVLKVDKAVDSRLMEMALARCERLPIEGIAFAWWCGVALQGDTCAAIEVLERRLNECADATAIVLGVFSLLTDRREQLPVIPTPSFRTTAGLRDLIPFAYRYVQREDDVDRTGRGAYSPNDRDHAQDFRGRLLECIRGSIDPAAGALLRELLGNEALRSDRDWIQHLIDERIERDADGIAWMSSDIRLFQQEYETTPKTDSDLFRIVCNRLQDIKHGVEASENSLRDEVQYENQEAGLRRWIARKLNERARGRYSAPQESEIDLASRPDIRVQNPDTDSVSIEVKWACLWSGPELFERLENQLVGDYLRAHNSRYGIYLLGLFDNRDHWKDSKGNQYSFEELIANLTERAATLCHDRDGVVGLKVVAIDFRTPMRVKKP